MTEQLSLDIHLISRCTHNYYARELRKLGITMGQFPFIVGVADLDGVSQEQLSRGMRISKSTTAAVVRQLMDKGLLTREVDPDDRRNFRLHITESARPLIPRIRKAIGDCHATLLKDVPESEREHFAGLLAAVRRTAEKSL